MIIQKDYPCRGCTERHRACWDYCEKYAAAKYKPDTDDKRDAAARGYYKHVQSKPAYVRVMNILARRGK